MKAFVLILSLVFMGMAKPKPIVIQKNFDPSPICQLKPDPTGKGGGVDGFPWSLAKPISWNKLQGVWKSYDKKKGHIAFTFDITRQDKRTKQIYVRLINTTESKISPTVLTGVGFFSEDEKNVIRVIIRDRMLKFAFFDTMDLNVIGTKCEERVLALSSYTLDDCENNNECNENKGQDYSYQNSLLLKKVPSR